MVHQGDGGLECPHFNLLTWLEEEQVKVDPNNLHSS